ncbi:MAG: hypothetical protein KDA41_14055, partial [Planctomycetales bacterium]|nr:hypothetical protein [Planctomycetales bacterium]
HDADALGDPRVSARNASQSSPAGEAVPPGDVVGPPPGAVVVEPPRLPAGAISADGLPPDWPDPSGFIPPGPQAVCTDCQPSFAPILSLTRSYNGHDSDITEALASYYEYRDEARFGGWQAYLQRSEDFIRFCCYMHITEMLAARGGAHESKVVYRWPISRYDR